VDVYIWMCGMSWLVVASCRGASQRAIAGASSNPKAQPQHVWSDAIVEIVGNDAAGLVCGNRTGFLVDAHGHVVTAVDLFAGTGCTQATVFVRSVPCTVSDLYGVDVDRGLAVLRIDSAVRTVRQKYLHVCQLDLTPGQRLRILGYVQGRQHTSEHVVTRIVQSAGQLLEAYVSGSIDEECIGAPACTETGQVVGLAVCPTNAPGVTIVVPQPPLAELLHRSNQPMAISDAVRHCILGLNSALPKHPTTPMRCSTFASVPVARIDVPHSDQPFVAVTDDFCVGSQSAEMSNLST
jgi:hypothetical protein